MSSNKALSRSLAALMDGDAEKHRLVKMIATRAMNEAQYCSAGAHSRADYYHYGLAEEFYTHFTSPIRRYADIVVHRQLANALAATGQGPAALSTRFVAASRAVEEVTEVLDLDIGTLFFSVIDRLRLSPISPPSPKFPPGLVE